ncbi:MIS12 protein-like [Scleropages formosus]|uniref:Protein MIS12 homolog n=1 Tax=Scleropages formosus TaxID=113540 RepID=A0A0P7TJT4_SCLFO|nr:protein MIS12 homolog [Scleropages formosus]KPP61126.1 MIS12 protein-like [Scleropages formosus]
MAESGNQVEPLSPESLKLYEAQFFGFTPQTCMLRVYSAFQDCLHDILLAVEAVFVRKLAGAGPEDELSHQARECTQKLHKFLQERVRRLSNRMEALLLDNVLSVPSHVLLPEDQPHSKHPQGAEQLLKLEAELARLEQAYQAEVCARQAILAELKEQEEVQEELDGVLKWIGELRAAWTQEGTGGVQDSFAFMTQTVKTLKGLMKGIRTKNGSLDHF